ncbi:HMG-Y-related protein A-like [Cynara cardunculus var. scolymus]|uniref:AT hook, DNA-binding motif-containing protein n=1 Tax=Cynara cardunculus var. scolymus TaxID=59895 RepID=A0A124SBY6_CYNCS|nr:HMG-Y-related protein A-like [Cynara cardunculus var. scolymus]KVH92096.1 AT hook, DNA-binding motif-containing protein [Cynara cardunculus var. scolymus]
MAASLPPYPQMILEAIDGLKQKEGSNKSSISNFIESTYGDLPDGHINELTDHLNKLKDSGDLVFVKNNYMRPDPNAPLKRGRGRPAKAKDPSGGVETQDPVVQGESGVEMKRGRGRPRKDPNAAPAAKKVKVVAASGGGRPRGRPRKVQAELAGVVAN